MNISVDYTFVLANVRSVTFLPNILSFLPIFNKQKNEPNTFPELIIRTFPKNPCLPHLILMVILLIKLFINIPQMIIPIP